MSGKRKDLSHDSAGPVGVLHGFPEHIIIQFPAGDPRCECNHLPHLVGEKFDVVVRIILRDVQDEEFLAKVVGKVFHDGQSAAAGIGCSDQKFRHRHHVFDGRAAHGTVIAARIGGVSSCGRPLR